MKSINVTTVTFPDVNLQVRDGHKLRGYFGNLFKEFSPLLHNHYEDGKTKYEYPLVQYKVLDSIPTLIALEEGVDLLNRLFLKIDHIIIENRHIEIRSKNVKTEEVEIGYTNELKPYSFQTLWLALNQKNYKEFRSLGEKERKSKLSRILIGNVLSFYKHMGVFLEHQERLFANVDVHEKQTNFKGKTMIAFQGHFLINAKLINCIGLGKSVSRGFGCISSV